MNDDIVTRLREMWGSDDRCIWCGQNMYDMNGRHHPVCDLMEAADEIERLREWKELAYQLRNKYWWAMRTKTLEKFDSMHKEDWARHRD